ncbi:unnamed protein product [Choristocarpus tenellus]
MVDTVDEFKPSGYYRVEPLVEGFSATNAHYFTHLCRVAYKDPEIAKVELCSKLGYTKFFWFNSDHNNHHGYVVAQTSHVAVVFRGTDSKANWATNLDVLLTRTKHGHLHRGFHYALDSMWSGGKSTKKGLRRIIKSLQANHPTRPLFVCGHSLGAALASVAAARLELDVDEVSVTSVYTIGSPRVFARDYAAVYDKALKSKTFRAVNNNDLVARFPHGLKHVGIEVYIGSSGTIRPRRCYDRIVGRWDSLVHGRLDDGRYDHQSVRYEEAFLAAIETEKAKAKRSAKNVAIKAEKRGHTNRVAVRGKHKRARSRPRPRQSRSVKHSQ